MNWNKWIIELLPIGLRRVRIYALIRTCCNPVKELHQTMREFRKKQIRYTSFIPSCQMLLKLIQDEVFSDYTLLEGSESGSMVLHKKEEQGKVPQKIYVTLTEKYIEEEGEERKEYGSGKPYDFVVLTNVLDQEREQKLYALIDRYKMAGKSYYPKNRHFERRYDFEGFVSEVDTTNTLKLTIKEIVFDKKYEFKWSFEYLLESDLKISYNVGYKEESDGEKTPNKIENEYKKRVQYLGGESMTMEHDMTAEFVRQNFNPSHSFTLKIKQKDGTYMQVEGNKDEVYEYKFNVIKPENA